VKLLWYLRVTENVPIQDTDNEEVEWIHLAHYRTQWRALAQYDKLHLNLVKEGNFLPNDANVNSKGHCSMELVSLAVLVVMAYLQNTLLLFSQEEKSID
jgi:hypothetical protein